jgi:hypothetical protein
MIEAPEAVMLGTIRKVRDRHDDYLELTVLVDDCSDEAVALVSDAADPAPGDRVRLEYDEEGAAHIIDWLG